PGAHQPTGTVDRYVAREREDGLQTPEPYRAFAARVARLRAELPGFVAGLRRQGPVAAYGAAAKGVVLMNTCGLGADLIDFVADRSPHKQGCRMPGTHVPIVAPGRVFEERPPHLVVLAWNFFEEIARQMHGFGGRFVLPLPSPHV